MRTELKTRTPSNNRNNTLKQLQNHNHLKQKNKMIEKQKSQKTLIVTQLNCRGLNKKQNRNIKYIGKNPS